MRQGCLPFSPPVPKVGTTPPPAGLPQASCGDRMVRVDGRGMGERDRMVGGLLIGFLQDTASGGKVLNFYSIVILGVLGSLYSQYLLC